MTVIADADTDADAADDDDDDDDDDGDADDGEAGADITASAGERPARCPPIPPTIPYALICSGSESWSSPHVSFSV
jgi:hypothetical protein